MGSLNLLISLFLGVAVAVKGNDTSLSVLEPELALNEWLNLNCGGIEETPHPLARVSWILITGKKEEQLNTNKTGALKLRLSANRRNAYVTCRSHAHFDRSLVVLATPPLRLRIAKAPRDPDSVQDNLAFIIVHVKINSSSYTDGASTYKTRVGENIVFICESLNLRADRLNYKYILQRNAAGNIEKELNASILSHPREDTYMRHTVTSLDHNTRVSCLARWFDRTTYYDVTTALRSESIQLIVEPKTEHEDCGFPYVWVAVGVGALGWLVAVTSLGVMCCRRRNLTNECSDSTMVLDGSSSGCGCLSSDSPSPGPLGATILPSENAHSLAAANIKLTPQSAPTVQNETVVYSNLEELNAMMKRFQRY